MAETVTVVKLGPAEARKRPELHVVRHDSPGGRRVVLVSRPLTGVDTTLAGMTAREAYDLQGALLAAARWAQGADNQPVATDPDPKGG